MTDERFRKGLELFNEEHFFEAHEVWEGLWHETRGEPRDFIQGLIQITSAFHQWVTGNMRGVRLLYESSRKLLRPYGDFYEGIDLKKLQEETAVAFAEILAAPAEDLVGRGGKGHLTFPYRPDRAPKIKIPQ